MENQDEIDFYIPLRNQFAKIYTGIIPILIFSVIQLIRTDTSGGYGILEYWLFSSDPIPNDHKLLLFGSIITMIILLTQFISSLIKRDKEKSLFNIFLSGLLGIIPAICNLTILLFFFYLIFYRGFWSISEFRNGFSFIPILKLIFFVGFGFYGYTGFSHLYQLRRLLKVNKKDEAISYVVKHKLFDL